VLGAGWSVIRGNGEYYLLDYGTPRAPAAWSHPTEATALAWLHEQLAERYIGRVATWPDSLSLRYPAAPPLRVVHGSPRSHYEGLSPLATADEIAERLAGVDEPVIVAGHTHVPMDRTVDRWRVFNPGSVGLPLDGRHAASYLVLDGDEGGWQPTFRRVPYDVNLVLAEFEWQQVVERCGVIGHLMVREFATARTQLSPFQRWRAAARPDAELSEALLAEFTAIDPEPYRGPLHRSRQVEAS